MPLDNQVNFASCLSLKPTSTVLIHDNSGFELIFESNQQLNCACILCSIYDMYFLLLLFSLLLLFMLNFEFVFYFILNFQAPPPKRSKCQGKQDYTGPLTLVYKNSISKHKSTSIFNYIF